MSSKIVYKNFLSNEILCYMHEAFKEYSEYFENDVMLDFINVAQIKNVDSMVKKFEKVIHNQQQKMRLYNFIFYKLFIINQSSDIDSRLRDTHEILNFILNYDDLFMSMCLCTFEKSILGKNVSSRDFLNKIKILKDAYNNKSINLKLFGYSIYESKNRRLQCIEYIIDFYGIVHVLKVFKKIKNLNSVFKEDYEYIEKNHHLYPGYVTVKMNKSICHMDYNSYNEVYDCIPVEGKQNDISDCDASIGMPLEDNNASCDSMMNYHYFIKISAALEADKKINKKISILHDTI